MIHISYSSGRRARLLRAELDHSIAAADRLDPQQKEAFRAIVGHPGQRLDVGGAGVAKIQADRTTGAFELAESGQLAIILAARTAPVLFGGEIIDLIAWVRRSGEVFRRFSTASALGEWNLGPLPPASLHIHANPGAWARSGGSGVFILDWAAAPGLLLPFSHLTADDDATAHRLRVALTPKPAILPTITTQATTSRAEQKAAA